MSALNVSSSREDRRRRLLAEIDAWQVQADALRSLALLIAATPVTVGRYGPVWNAVLARLRRDVEDAQRAVAHAQDRLRVLDDADAAASRWIPRRSA